MSLRDAKVAHRPGGDALEYDPFNSAAVIHNIDVELGYRRHHLTCLESAPRTGLGPLDALSRRGFAKTPALSQSTSAELVSQFRGAGDVLCAKDLGKSKIDSLFDEMFSGPLGPSIQRFFGCSFGVLFLDFGISKPMPSGTLGGADGVSFKWHCDVAPTPYVKLLVYLTGPEEHDGATEFIDLAATARFHRIGYALCPISRRLGDLTDLAALHDVDFDPERLCPEQGEAAAFSPGQVLHKGIPPTDGDRVLMSVGIIPTLTDWRGFLASNYGFLCNTPLGEFPRVS